jgi:hypothetical protein
MGSAGLLRTSGIESNLVSVFGGIVNKLPRAIATGIKRNHELRAMRRDKMTQNPLNQLYSEPSSKMTVMNLRNTSYAISTTGEKAHVADNAYNHANLAYANMAAMYIGAIAGRGASTIVMPGKTSQAFTLINNALK